MIADLYELTSHISESFNNAAVIITTACSRAAEELLRAAKEREEREARKRIEIMLFEVEQQAIDENECAKIECLEKLLEMAKEPEDRDRLEWERGLWNKAAALTRSKAASRAQAFACRMQGEKARRTMKRRKLLHAEGHFPDMVCGL